KLEKEHQRKVAEMEKALEKKFSGVEIDGLILEQPKKPVSAAAGAPGKSAAQDSAKKKSDSDFADPLLPEEKAGGAYKKKGVAETRDTGEISKEITLEPIEEDLGDLIIDTK
ncbi:MAG: hypothetical protein PHQ23_11160, partial [Candidatus Wallbacteria bacterium]|nr:hypothetical protein [Candidatus Wallbacteria bacterium]